MNLETARRIFTEGHNNGWDKENPYKGAEGDVYQAGQCVGVNNFEAEFVYWRRNNNFPLSYREEAESNKHLIPEEFWDMMESQAYDRGHSAGEDEVDLILFEIVNDFVGALGKYAIRTGKTL